MPRLRRLLLPFLLLVLAGGAVAGALVWRNLPAKVSVEPVRRGPAVEAVYATGTIEPVNWAKVQAVSAGRIIEVPVREGDRVARGDVLARQDATRLEARLKELGAQIEFQRAEMARLDALARTGVVSPQARQKAESELSQAQAAIAGVRSQIEDTVLRAPLEGDVLRRDVEVGEVANVNEPLFWIGSPQPLWAVVDVDEEDIPRVRPGQPVLLKADAFPGRLLDGTVERITPKGDPVLKTYRVRVALPADTPLLIGMTVEANVVIRREDAALLVPDTAVERGRVFVVKGEQVEARPVEIGVVGEGRAEIRAGLAEGERVVISPPSGLADGARVRVPAAAP